MSDASEKGNALEAAVAAIEQHILCTSPSLREKTFTIENKKRIVVGGVHHEIDVFVTINVGAGYKSVFIFECKNWESRVGKNEIIVFSEKVEAAQAQHGYFVAKSFTKDAKAQARMDRRISLVRASERDPTRELLPVNFYAVDKKPLNFKPFLHVRSRNPEDSPLPLTTMAATFRGQALDLRKYLAWWADGITDEAANKLQPYERPAGVYPLEASGERQFAPGELIVEGHDIASIEMTARCQVAVMRPIVVSSYDVASRGRFVSIAPFELSTGTRRMTMAWRENGPVQVTWK
jgi:hypothetical protein